MESPTPNPKYYASSCFNPVSFGAKTLRAHLPLLCLVLILSRSSSHICFVPIFKIFGDWTEREKRKVIIQTSKMEMTTESSIVLHAVSILVL